MSSTHNLETLSQFARDGFVDGRILEPQSSHRLSVVSPRDARIVSEFAASSVADVDRAVTSARRVFESGLWPGLPLSERRKRLLRFADLVERNSSFLDAVDALEMGKPVSIKVFGAASAANYLRFCAEAVDKIIGDTLPSDSTSLVLQQLQPRGVVGAIIPWNFPTYNALLKVAPALAAGNTVVLKPSELSPGSAMKLAELAVAADIPPGAFNVVQGSGPEVGAALASHHGVDMIAFTGSSRVGGKMLQYAGASNLKPVVAECGGKSPQIVFADGVDLAITADAVAGSILLNQGQVCSAGSRLLVQREVETELVELILERIKRVRIGDPLDPEKDFGPIVSERQLQRVKDFVRLGLEEGGRAAYCGNGLAHESQGYFIEPVVLVDVDPKSAISQQEIFGPVLAVNSFKDVDEAINLANGTAYGLAAYCWTTNLQTGMKVAQKVRSGLNIVNPGVAMAEGAGHAFNAEPFAMSGIGVEGGIAGVVSYMRRQTIWYNF